MDVSLPSLQISEDNLKPSGRVMAFSSEAALRTFSSFFQVFLLQAPELLQPPQVTKKTFETIQFLARQFQNFSSMFNSESEYNTFYVYFFTFKKKPVQLGFFFSFFTVHSFSKYMPERIYGEKKEILLKSKLARCYKSLGWIGRL